MNEFTRLEQFAKLQKPPAIKFHDLEAEITSKITFNVLPMRVQVDFFPVTDASVLTNFTIQFNNKDLEFKSAEGVQRAAVNILGRITSMTRRPISNFEDTVEVLAPKEMLQEYAKNKSIYQKTVPLVPGTYRLNVVAKDAVAGTIALYEAAITVPRLDPDKLSSSSLVLADILQTVPTRSIGAGMFVIGGSKVRPRLDDTFRRDEKLGIYMKLYNFGADDNTHKPEGQIEYVLVKSGSNDKIIDVTEDVGQVPDASASQITIQKLLPLKDLAPGQYTLQLKVTDRKNNQVLTPSAKFTIT